MAAVCRQNSTALDSIRQQLGDIGGTLEGSFASDINKLSYKVCTGQGADQCCVQGAGR